MAETCRKRPAQLIRREPRASDGWNNGDIDTCFQLFRCGMVWDGNLCSKCSRDHLVEHGYAVQWKGFQSLTGKGVVAFLMHRAVWSHAIGRWRRWKKNPFIASEYQIRRALD